MHRVPSAHTFSFTSEDGECSATHSHEDPKAIRFRRISINDLNRRPSPLPNADAWRAGEPDLPASAFHRNVRPAFDNARPVRAMRTQHLGEHGDRVVALEGDEGRRFG